jgi:hypothetical protein
MYDCRNDFLHGNPVDRNCIRLPHANRSVFNYAAPLYHTALAQILLPRVDQPESSLADSDARGAFIAARHSFLWSQRIIEDALLIAVAKPESSEDIVSP